MGKLIFYLVLGFPSFISAQKRCIIDTTVVNNSSSNFFIQNPVVDSLKVYGYSYNSAWIYVYSKTFWQDTSYYNNSYSTESYSDFAGDKYMFEKKYGKLNLPEKNLLKELAKKIRNSGSYSIIKADSIKHVVDFYCPENDPDDEDKIFTKIEVVPKYKDGIKQLQNEMQYALSKKHPIIECLPEDSALIYEIMVNRKDSCLKRIKLIEGKYSAFERFVMEELKNHCSWLPARKDSRPIDAYIQIFIRLNRDKSITVAI